MPTVAKQRQLASGGGAYLQTSTANPYGHRPWATRLYTSFDDYSYLKQPQNLILRENQDMRPEIYAPPDLRGMGAIVVSGSGRVLGRSRRRGMRGLGIVYADGFANFPTPYHGPVFPGPMPVRPMPPIIVVGPVTSGPSSAPTPVLPPPVLPPTIVPPVPSPVTSGPGGTVYALPGDASTPGSPFTPAPPSELGPGTPTTLPAGAAAASTTPPFDFSGWFNSETIIAGWPNGYVAIAGAGVLWLLTRTGKRGR